ELLEVNRRGLRGVGVVREANKKAVITQRDSRGVPDRSTNRALRRLTSEFRWDPVH
ncbi:hypothetical protein ETH_00014105, partial [Eimeria tenella]